GAGEPPRTHALPRRRRRRSRRTDRARLRSLRLGVPRRPLVRGGLVPPTRGPALVPPRSHRVGARAGGRLHAAGRIRRAGPPHLRGGDAAAQARRRSAAGHRPAHSAARALPCDRHPRADRRSRAAARPVRRPRVVRARAGATAIRLRGALAARAARGAARAQRGAAGARRLWRARAGHARPTANSYRSRTSTSPLTVLTVTWPPRPLPALPRARTKRRGVPYLDSQSLRVRCRSHGAVMRVGPWRSV